MKRIPGIKPQFTRCRIVRPDGNVFEAWEMFVGERSFGRSNSKTALLRSWEARLEEAENARPFVFRPAHRLQNANAKRPPGVGGVTAPQAPRPEAPKVVAGHKRGGGR